MTVVAGMSVRHRVTGMWVDRSPVVVLCHEVHVTFEINCAPTFARPHFLRTLASAPEIRLGLRSAEGERRSFARSLSLQPD